MRKKISLIFLVLIFTTLTSCRKHDSILLIGIDNQGKEIEVKVDGDKFVSSAVDTIKNTNDSTMTMLEENKNAAWNIEKVEIGVGVNLTAGTDKLWKWSYNPGYKLIYQKIQ